MRIEEAAESPLNVEAMHIALAVLIRELCRIDEEIHGDQVDRLGRVRGFSKDIDLVVENGGRGDDFFRDAKARSK